MFIPQAVSRRGAAENGQSKDPGPEDPALISPQRVEFT
ncbi:hypothetical protein D1AOALGA4SA_83 [Olavius algarvensis Delta 1 endosymbiont]|nr:hypothetical protein D1AOALGA4SA_83 [Olavius algarvensis Delta 1 endosymbiont]